MNKLAVQVSAPVPLTLEPNEVQVVLYALKKLPYENVAQLIDKLCEACQPKPVEPPT